MDTFTDNTGVVRFEGTISGGSSTYLQTAPLIVTPAQIKDLAANPVTLIAAPGPSKIVIPWRWTILVPFVSTPYTLNGGQTPRGDWAGLPLSGGGGNGWMSVDQVFFAVSDVLLSAVTQVVVGPVEFQPLIDAAFVLGNPGADLTDGDSDATFVVDYTVLAV